MSLNSSKEDSDHLSNYKNKIGEEYEGATEEVEDGGKRKDKQSKESIQRRQKRERLMKLRKMGMTEKIGTIAK